jgi:hypothetical protein
VLPLFGKMGKVQKPLCFELAGRPGSKSVDSSFFTKGVDGIISILLRSRGDNAYAYRLLISVNDSMTG